MFYDTKRWCLKLYNRTIGKIFGVTNNDLSYDLNEVTNLHEYFSIKLISYRRRAASTKNPILLLFLLELQPEFTNAMARAFKLFHEGNNIKGYKGTRTEREVKHLLQIISSEFDNDTYRQPVDNLKKEIINSIGEMYEISSKSRSVEA